MSVGSRTAQIDRPLGVPYPPWHAPGSTDKCAPSTGIKRPKEDEIRSWTDAELKVFERRWPTGTKQRADTQTIEQFAQLANAY